MADIEKKYYEKLKELHTANKDSCAGCVFFNDFESMNTICLVCTRLKKVDCKIISSKVDLS